ncbi:MAG: diguanylate cyclase, partial [Clostridiaceae bacterium]|nr:diguanylate cyclase [Clostridiaceae bacterium]
LCIGMGLAASLLYIPPGLPHIAGVLPAAVLAVVSHLSPLAMLPGGVRRHRRKASFGSETVLGVLAALWGLRLAAAMLIPTMAELFVDADYAAVFGPASPTAARASVAGAGILIGIAAGLLALCYQNEMEHSRRLRRRYDSMFEDNPAALLIVRCKDGCLLDVNPAAAALYGYERGALAGLPLDKLLDPEESPAVRESIRTGPSELAPREMFHRTADGSRRYVRVSGSRIAEDSGDYLLCTITDLSSLRAEAEQAAFLSIHDQLTGVYSRNWISGHLTEIETRLEKQPLGFPTADSDTTVLSIDINNLRTINEQRGTQTGDQVLVEVASQLRTIVPPRTPIARTGGDEFLVLLHDTRTDQAYGIARRLAAQFKDSNRLGFPVGISCGIATAEECDGHLQAACSLAENRLLEDKLNRADSLLSAPIQTLLALLHERYIETEEHALRLKDLSLALARAIGLPVSQYANLELLANLHDIGKVAISESILLKPGPLDEAERAVMCTHPDIGARIVSLIPHASSVSEDIRSHHERWDGTGYPRGLAGEDIPLLARIVALADAWDAMTHDRPYKPAMKWADAIREIDAGRGWQFNPYLAEVFLRMVGG